MPEGAASPEFKITGCHADRAGHASVTLRHVPTGATVAVHNVPFQHDYDENVRDECRRIAVTAAEVGERAMAFLKTQFEHGVAPQQEPAPGAAPNDAEPPSRLGQT